MRTAADDAALPPARAPEQAPARRDHKADTHRG